MEKDNREFFCLFFSDLQTIFKKSKKRLDKLFQMYYIASVINFNFKKRAEPARKKQAGEKNGTINRINRALHFRETCRSERRRQINHTVIYGREPEWHHSGFYKAAGMRKKTMGRTFFFEVDELDVLAGQWGLLETKREHRKAVEEHAKLEKLNFLKSIVGGYKAEAAAKGYKEGWVYYKLKEYCDDYQLLKEALK